MSDEIKQLKDAVMVAIVELYEKSPQDVINKFGVVWLSIISKQVETLRPKQVEDIYMAALKVAELKEQEMLGFEYCGTTCTHFDGQKCTLENEEGCYVLHFLEEWLPENNYKIIKKG